MKIAKKQILLQKIPKFKREKKAPHAACTHLQSL